jgi:hypothetical protein
VLIELLRHWDVRLKGGEGRPKNIYNGLACGPNTGAKIEFRRRKIWGRGCVVGAIFSLCGAAYWCSGECGHYISVRRDVFQGSLEWGIERYSSCHRREADTEKSRWLAYVSWLRACISLTLYNPARIHILATLCDQGWILLLEDRRLRF